MQKKHKAVDLIHLLIIWARPVLLLAFLGVVVQQLAVIGVAGVDAEVAGLVREHQRLVVHSGSQSLRVPQVPVEAEHHHHLERVDVHALVVVAHDELGDGEGSLNGAGSGRHRQRDFTRQERRVGLSARALDPEHSFLHSSHGRFVHLRCGGGRTEETVRGGSLFKGQRTAQSGLQLGDTTAKGLVDDLGPLNLLSVLQVLQANT